MRRRSLLGTTALIAATIILMPLQSATAATGDLEVSPDGVAFSSAMAGTLFDDIAQFVPGDSDKKTFYVRNGSAEPGHLRITLKDVVAADADFADALTVSASTAGQASPATTLLVANPCWVLLQGVTLSPGQTVAVTASVALGNMHGLAGQGAAAEFALGVGLSSAEVPLPPTHCGLTDTTIPGSTLTSSQRGTPQATVQAPRDEQSADPPAPAGSEELPVLSLPELLGIDPNTWRFFEGYLVLILIAAFAAGSAWFAIAARHRRKNERVLASDEDGALG